MTNNYDELPTACRNCGSYEINYESRSEYTGGGYADYWYEFHCIKCGYLWRSKEKTSFF